MSLTSTVVNTSTEAYLAVTIPNGRATPIPGTERAVSLLFTWMKWVGYIAAGIGLLIFFAHMTIQKRRGDNPEMGMLGWILVAVIGIGASAGIIGTLASA